MKCANCEKVLTTKMEVEYSAWLTEYFCSPKCASDRYFNYMESTPVDFENLPTGLEVVNGKLQAAEQSVNPTSEAESQIDEDWSNDNNRIGDGLSRFTRG